MHAATINADEFFQGPFEVFRQVHEVHRVSRGGQHPSHGRKGPHVPRHVQRRNLLHRRTASSNSRAWRKSRTQLRPALGPSRPVARLAAHYAAVRGYALEGRRYMWQVSHRVGFRAAAPRPGTRPATERLPCSQPLRSPSRRSPPKPASARRRPAGSSAETGYASDDAAAKVQAAAGKLGYKPNTLARSLVTGRSQTIGVLLLHRQRLLRAGPARNRRRGVQRQLSASS